MYSELIYSYGIREIPIELAVPPPELAPLAAIQAKLVEAAALSNARRYQAAIASYQAAQSMIFGHLNAKGPTPSGFDVEVPLKWILFEPLLSASVEWLNVLPVTQPRSSVRSRVPVDDGQLGEAAPFARMGLFSEALSSQAAIDASADLQLAAQMQVSGNASAAQFFIDRAQERDRTTFELLSEHVVEGDGGALRVATGGTMVGVANLSAQGHMRVAEAAGAVATRAQELTESVQLHLPPSVTSESRTFATVVAGDVATFAWQAGSGPPLEEIKEQVYEVRKEFTDLKYLVSQPASPAEAALYLPHNYYYAIPLGLAECYRALGDFTRAEAEYRKASTYRYLNTAIEAPFVWLRLAETYLLWGDSLYRADETALARAIYERVLKTDGTAPQGTLYSTELATGADAARKVIANLDTLLSGEVDADSIEVNPAIVAVVLEAHEQLTKIDAGLDFWGQSVATVPIWTFEYLQSVAINFAQLAIAAERDFIQFQERSDQGSLTRQQLQQGVILARAEKAAAKQQTAAVDAEVAAYEAAVATSQKRAENAEDNAWEYEQASAGANIHQAMAAQMSGGESGNADNLNAYADVMMGREQRGGHVHFYNGSLGGSPALMGAAAGLVAARLSAEYEVRSLRRQAEEMQLVAEQAKRELKVAKARAKAALAAEAVANARENAARQTLAAFNAQFFTPDVWGRMADTMRGLYRRYLHMAIRTARLMQRAYNFETDQELEIIKLDYGGSEIQGLLAADLLMADIQSFTFDLISNTRSKPQPLRQTISLAERHAYAFETQLRQTGTMELQTRLEDFDEAYPGIYAGRIEAVEVMIDGIVPPIGVSGALTNEGFSQYRTPRPDPAGNDVKIRVQSRETLILSDHDVRADALVNPGDRRMTRMFQGAGLASAWRLELPPAINDIDYNALTDVRITFHYQARFDPDLRKRVLQDLANRPGANERQLGIPLRWLFPDAFFNFYETGRLEIPIEQARFPSNQLDPTVISVGLVLVTTPRERAKDVVLQVSAPEQDPITATTDADGAVLASELDTITGGPVHGSWRIELGAADNAAWVENDKLKLDAIHNLALILGYSFTPQS